MSITKKSNASGTSYHLTGAHANNFMKAPMKPEAKTAPPTVQELAKLGRNAFLDGDQTDEMPGWELLSPSSQNRWIKVIHAVIARIEASR